MPPRDPLSDPLGATNPIDDSFEVDIPEDVSSYNMPDGEYEAVVVDITRETSNNGNPMWVWTLKGTEGASTGKELKLWTALTPNAMWKVAETLEALGLGAPGQNVKFSKAEAIGKRCRMVVLQREYEGKRRSSIDSIMPSKTPAGAGL